MPTRKQRRRRQKELRHEYEIVYVDEEGRELEEAEDAAASVGERRNGTREPKQARPAKKRGGRPLRPVQPPSWSRVVRRALLFGPLIFVAFSLINRDQPVVGRLAVAAAYTLFFIPFMYLMDRAMYRSYLRRSGGEPPPKPRAPRKR
jgi:hypothetical protein